MQKRIIQIVLETDRQAAMFMLLFQVIKGVLPAFLVMAYASFIDTTILAFQGETITRDVLMQTLTVLVLMLVQYASGNLLTYYGSRCRVSVEVVEKNRLLQKVQKIRFSKMESASTYEIINHVEKGIPDTIYDAYAGLLGCMNLLITVISITAIIFRYSFFLTMITLLCFVPIVLVSVRGGKEDYSSLEEYFEILRRQESFEEILMGEKQVCERKLYNFTPWLIKRWKGKYEEGMQAFLSYKKKSYSRVKKLSLFVKLMLWIVVGMVILMAVKGSATIGVCAILIQQIMSLCSRVTWDLYAYLYDIATAGEYLHKYEECYGLPEADSGEVTLTNAERIEFRDVSFRYSESSPYVLQHLNLTLEKGRAYALVGENGAGKSTLTKLLLGFYKEYEGTILVDGVELRRIKEKKELFSPVFQNFARYETTLRQNVGMGKEKEITDEKIRKAAQYMELDLSDKLGEEGYDIPLGRLHGRNVDFSGGQWQKIAMMRALLQHKQWLVLDEPTAALDPVTETGLYHLFFKLMEDKTCLLITHRLGAARLADEILVLADGRIKEQGNHEALLKTGPRYREMYQKQKGWYQDGTI